MNRFFAVFLYFTLLNGFAQLTPDQVIAKYDEMVKSQPLKLPETQKTAYQQLLLRSFIEKSEIEFCHPKYSSFIPNSDVEATWQEIFSKFHLIDLDDDGDLDLIFSGKLCEHHAQEYLMIFTCEYNSNYTLSLFTEGKPIVLNENNEFVCVASDYEETTENTIKVFQFKEDRIEEKFQVKHYDPFPLIKANKKIRIGKSRIPQNLSKINECELGPGTITYIAPIESMMENSEKNKVILNKFHQAHKVNVYFTFIDSFKQEWNYISYTAENNPNLIVLAWVKSDLCD